MSLQHSADVLSAFAAELTSMTAMVEGLSRLVAEHVRQSQGPARALALVEAQTIDELNQRLHALSALAAALSRGDDVQAALEAIPLADLAARLQAAILATVSRPLDRPGAGELMLFE